MCCYSELFYEIFLGCSFYALPCEINRFFFKSKRQEPSILKSNKETDVFSLCAFSNLCHSTLGNNYFFRIERNGLFQ